MSDLSIKYKNAEIATLSASGTKTLKTKGMYCEDDITVQYTKPAAETFTTEEKTVSPTESLQEVTPTSANALSKVTVNPISSTYVGSGITKNPTPTASGATVTIPSGYYSSQTTKSVSSGSLGTVSASKGTVSNHSIIVTPSISGGTAGYISQTSKTGTGVTVSANELVSGSQTLNENKDYDVTNLESVTVAVPIPTFSTQEKTVTPSESVQYATPDSGKDGLSKVTVEAISSTYVGSGITRRSSTNLSASGATVTVPAGYYESQATKAVASGSAGTPSASKGAVTNHSITVTPTVTNTTGYITGGTKTGNGVMVSASELVSGSETKVENGTYNVTNLAELVVDVPVLDTSDATATSRDIVSEETAYVNGEKITGTILRVRGDSGYFSSSEMNYVSELNGNIRIHSFLNSPNEIICIERDEDFPHYSASVSSSEFGTAMTSEVLSGATFTSSAGYKETGTLQVQTCYKTASVPSNSIGNNGDLCVVKR